MKKTFLTLLIMLCLAAVAPLARAQENPEKAESDKTKEEGPAQVAFKWTNLLILFGGLVYLLRKPAREFFATRKSEITSGLERAQVAHDESTRRMREIEQRLSRLSSEIESLRKQADAESAQEREKILVEAKRDVERLVEQSRREIDRIARGIERNIKEKLADAVIERATRTLETQMTEDDQKRVVVRFLKKV
ncbi:MAG TPA: ATP synthase F0 subunit B [Terriglobia bacterium]|nr:ATP synthase F0 subunit B [Terriglobia bacterium]